MSKITLTSLVNLQNETTAVNAINNNNSVITTAFDNTISRDGTNPNTMNASLDMNSHRIVNLPTGVSTSEPVTLAQMNAALVANGNTNTGLTGVPVSAAMQPVVAATTLPLAQTAFGISSAMQPVVSASTTAAANILLGNGSFPFVTPQQFDSLAGTAGHDSTAAIASAIAACPSGGTVRVPATTGGYVLSGGFTITKPINIIGDGQGTFFTGSVGATVDLFHVTPAASSGIRGVRFSNFAINTNVAQVQNFFVFDTTPAATYMAEVEVSKIFTLNTYPAVSCIKVADNTGSFFHADFFMNSFNVNNTNGACVFMDKAGDSIRIWNNILTGTGYGVLANQASGAGNILITGCNITATGGVNLTSCYKPIIRDCEMEFAGSILTGACVVFNNCIEGYLGANQIQVLNAATGYSENVAVLGTSSNISISGTTLSSAISGFGIFIGTSATGTRLGMDISYLGALTPVSNNGTGTRTASYS